MHSTLETWKQTLSLQDAAWESLRNDISGCTYQATPWDVDCGDVMVALELLMAYKEGACASQVDLIHLLSIQQPL
jgi:hypothetical protein